MARKAISLKDIKQSNYINNTDKILIQSDYKTLSASIYDLKDKLLSNTIPPEDISKIVNNSINGINDSYKEGQDSLDRIGVKAISDNIINYINNNFMMSTSRIINDTLIKKYDSNVTSNQINASSNLRSISISNFSPVSIDINIDRTVTSNISGYKMYGKFNPIPDLIYTFKFNIKCNAVSPKAVKIINRSGKELASYGFSNVSTETKQAIITLRTNESDVFIVYDNNCEFDIVKCYINYDQQLQNLDLIENRFSYNIKSNYNLKAYYKNMVNPESLPNNKYYDFSTNTYRVVNHTLTIMNGSVPNNAQVLKIELDTDMYYTISGIPEWRTSNKMYIVTESNQNTLSIYKEIMINNGGSATFYSSPKYVHPILYFVLYDGSDGVKDLCTTIQLEEGTKITEFYPFKDKTWQINPKIAVNERETLDGGIIDYRTIGTVNSIGCIRDEINSNGNSISRVSIIDRDAITNKIEMKKIVTDKYPNCDVYQFNTTDAPSYAIENGLINLLMYDTVNNKVILPKNVNNYSEGLYIISNTITWVVSKGTDISRFGDDLIIVYKKYMPLQLSDVNPLELSSDLRKIILDETLLPIECKYMSPYTEVVGSSSEAVVNILDGIVDDNMVGYIDYKSFSIVIGSLLESINLLKSRVDYLEEYATLIPENNV